MSRRNEVSNQFRKALRYGLTPKQFIGPFHDYLLSKLKKHKNSKIRIYCEYIYIYAGKKLITMYPVPDKYRPVETFLKSYACVEKRNIDPDMLLRDYYYNHGYNFYYRSMAKKDFYTVALVINDWLAAVSKGKGLEEQKLACVLQHINELKTRGDKKDETT